MSDSERIHIMIATVDNHLAHLLVQKIRAHLARLPIETTRVDDGRRALADFQNRQPSMIFVSADLPGLDGAALAREIRKRDGAVPIFFLKSQSDPAPEGVESIVVPIVDWTELLGRAQGAIPDDWKAKFGLFEGNSALYKKLAAYGERYKNSAAPQPQGPLVCIPRLFDSTVGAAQADSAPRAAATQDSVTVFREVSDVQSKRVVRIELTILLVLTLATIAAHLLKPGASEGLFSMKRLLAIVTVFSYFGFFLGRAFDRYVISKQLASK